jgi:hypothetical protein
MGKPLTGQQKRRRMPYLAHVRHVVMALEADIVFENFREEISVRIPILRLVMVNCCVETLNEIKKGLFSRIA